MAGINDVLQESIARELAAHRLRYDGSELAIELLHRGLERRGIVVAKRHRRARQLARHAERLKTGQQMPVERGIIAEVRGESRSTILCLAVTDWLWERGNGDGQ